MKSYRIYAIINKMCFYIFGGLMTKRKLLYISLGVILAALLIFLIFSLTGNIKFNTETHAEWEQNGITFSYKGSKEEIRELEISKNGEKLASFKLEADTSLFSSDGSQNAIFIDGEGENTLALVPFSLDAFGNKHYRTLCIKPDGTASIDLETDICNPTIESETGYISCESFSKENVGDELEGIGAPYEESATRTVYRADSEKLQAIYCFSVTYYSENDIYCISESQFDLELNSLGASSDDWLSPAEYKQSYEKLDPLFTVRLPEIHE